jgi:integrase
VALDAWDIWLGQLTREQLADRRQIDQRWPECPSPPELAPGICRPSAEHAPHAGIEQKLQARADKAWREAGLERITPHECRHTFASLMIPAGVNAKALQVFMGTPASRPRSTPTAT